MGYLSLNKTLDMGKATVSLWFRIPSATAAAIQYLKYLPDFEMFDGIIPILVFGRQRSTLVTTWHYQTVGSYWVRTFPNPPQQVFVYDSLPEGDHEGWLAPSFIGVNKNGFLAVHLQTGDVGVSSQTVFSNTNYTTNYPEFIRTVSVTYVDNSAHSFNYPDSLGNDGLSTEWQGFYAANNGFRVAFDQWHHLLISWDIGSQNASHGVYWGSSGGVSDKALFVDATSTMYCAIDGIDKKGDELPGMRYSNMRPNETISYGTYNIAGKSISIGPSNPPAQIGGPTAEPTYKVSFSIGIKADGIFIPALPAYNISYPITIGLPGGTDGSEQGQKSTRPIVRVDMAELMIWSGLMLTSDNASKFISSTGTPTPFESFPFGQPDIKIHGTQAWLRGNNSGHLIGDFSRVGTITPFKPDPQIGVGAPIVPAPALTTARRELVTPNGLPIRRKR
jgi:hypothetical protein